MIKPKLPNYKNIDYKKLPISHLVNLTIIVLLIASISTDYWFVSKSSIPINIDINIEDDDIRKIELPN